MRPTTIYPAAAVLYLLLASGCGVNGPAGPRIRADHEYWIVLDSEVRAVNDSRRLGDAHVLSTLSTSIDTLGRWPTNNVDPELEALGERTVQLFLDMKSYLQGRVSQAVLVGPGPSPEYLRIQQVALADEGARVHLVLTQRYGYEFPRTFDHAVELLDEPPIMTSVPYPYQYRPLTRLR